jgi:cytoskeletal protein RodZ
LGVKNLFALQRISKMNASSRTEDGMKTYSFITKREKTREAGSVAKAALGVVAVAVVGTAGFLVYAKGKPLSENPLAQITQAIQSKAPDSKAEAQKSESAPAAPTDSAPVASAPETQDAPPSEPATASVTAKATPLPLRVAPDGMVFLASGSPSRGIQGFPVFPKAHSCS